MQLDEAASVDSTAEAAIQGAIDELVRDRTVVVTAHRPRTIRRPIVSSCSRGRVVETGDHDSRVARDGVYAAMLRVSAEPRRPPSAGARESTFRVLVCAARSSWARRRDGPVEWARRPVLCPGPILVAALASATPAAPVEPLGGAAPASAPAPAATPTPTPAEVAAPLARPGPASSPTTVAPAGSGPAPVATPFGGEVPGPPPAPVDPRKQLVIRPEFLIGPVWRIRTTEVLTLANLEVGWLQGFSGTFHAGIIIAPDRDIIAAVDFPIGAGFIYRGRLGKRPLYGSVGLSAGVLVHRAGTDRGVVVRVDPDLQLPLRFAWTAGPVGLSIVLLQGFSGRSRTYERRGAEVWHRIPYRVGITVGIHFNIGVARKQSRRAAPGSKVPS